MCDTAYQYSIPPFYINNYPNGQPDVIYMLPDNKPTNNKYKDIVKKIFLATFLITWIIFFPTWVSLACAAPKSVWTFYLMIAMVAFIIINVLIGIPFMILTYAPDGICSEHV